MVGPEVATRVLPDDRVVEHPAQRKAIYRSQSSCPLAERVRIGQPKALRAALAIARTNHHPS